ncbi:MAG: hypothetical protein ABSD70_01335 [Terracidiphilus sp.]|jgi:hypothetical protein
MLDLILNFLPEWLSLRKTPMSPSRWRNWGKIRKLGSVLFVVIFTSCLGSLLFTIDSLWVAIEHKMVDFGDRTLIALYWYSGALIVGAVEWVLNERRFRLPPKAV